MMVLLTGGAKNGKSHHAERIFSGRGLNKVYLATMEPYGEEALEAIARHRAMRAQKGFSTVEKYRDIGEVSLPQHCGVLIECMSTLCANEMFSSAERRNPVQKILKDVERVHMQAELTVVVTNDVGSDGIDYEQGTAAYIQALGELNAGLAAMADCVIECVCGIALLLKGEWPWEF